jgi:CBS domain-containing protein
MKVGVVTCTPETKLKQLAHLILEHGVEDVVVLDEGNAIGVVGQAELVAAFSQPDFINLTVSDIIREEICQVPPDIPITAAVQIMQDKKARTIFMMHNSDGIEYPAASITYSHILRLISADDMSDLNDLGIYAERKSPIEVFIERREAARKRRLS